MIISHRHKFVFFRVPKTGSTTAEFMLRMCGAFNDEDIMTVLGIGQFPAVNIIDARTQMRAGQEVAEAFKFGPHMTPQNVIDAGLLTLDQIREYDCYAFVREPKARHLSGCVHSIGRHSTPVLIHRLLDQTLHPKVERTLGLLTIPQKTYFEVDGERVVTPLDFRNFETELRGLDYHEHGIESYAGFQIFTSE